jgi:hypothetical protein
MSLFERGFLRFAKNGALSDLALLHTPDQHTTNIYHVHRLILAYSSDFFRTLLSSDFKEKRQLMIRLNFPDPANVFPDILQFMYQGSLSISLQNVVPLLTQADYLLMPELVTRCRAFIDRHLTRQSAVKLLLDAVAFKQEDVIQTCLEFIARNFLHMSVVDDDEDEHSVWDWSRIHRELVGFERLPLPIVICLLTHPRLAVGDEWPLYVLVCRYIAANEEWLRPEDTDCLFQCVRFRWLSYPHLCHALRNRRVPRYLLVEACLARLQQLETPSAVVSKALPLRLQRRRWNGVSIEYCPIGSTPCPDSDVSMQPKTETTMSSSSSSPSSSPPSHVAAYNWRLSASSESDDDTQCVSSTNELESVAVSSGPHSSIAFSSDDSINDANKNEKDDGNGDDDDDSDCENSVANSNSVDTENVDRSESVREEKERGFTYASAKQRETKTPQSAVVLPLRPSVWQPPRGILWWLGADFSPLPSEESVDTLCSALRDTTLHGTENISKHSRRRWSNPCLLGRVRVMASSVERGQLHQLVDWGWGNDEPPQELWTMDIPASWVAIELPHFHVFPRAYALRHGGNYKADALRTWDFQGSNDGHTWTVIQRHKDDDTLNGPFATATFVVHCTQRFRYFRILQTGHNSSYHNFLVLSGLELYGDVWEIEDPTLSPMESSTTR